MSAHEADIHSCSYYCDRPGCIKAQRDELRERAAQTSGALQWSEALPPSDDCSYDHADAETPFGRLRIEWKSWKDDPGFTLDGPDWAMENVTYEFSLSSMKAAVEASYFARVRAALASIATAAPDETSQQLNEQIAHLRANLRVMTDDLEMLLDEGKFPGKGRSANEKESIEAWWERQYDAIKKARRALEHPELAPQEGERGARGYNS